MKVKLLIIFVLLSGNLLAQTDTCLVNSKIGISFPPVSNQDQREFAKKHLDSLNISRIRIAEDWSFREPTKGSYNWGPLDERISWAMNNQYEILLTIQSKGAPWACAQENDKSCVFNNNNEFKNYLDTLLKRYPNQINKIQFGNEWQSDFWYIGNAKEFINTHNVLYNAVQEHSSSTEVVLGGFTTSSLRYLAGCNGYIDSFVEDDATVIDSTFLKENCTGPEIVAVKQRIDSVLSQAQYDIIDIHLYDDVELWPALYANFTDTITKPIIVSEFGGPNLNVEPNTEAYQAAQLYRYIKVLDSLEIPEIYYFKLVEGTANNAHASSGLIEDTTLQIKEAYGIIKSFQACVLSKLEKKIEAPLHIFPNPGENEITIEYADILNETMTIIIHDLQGRIIIKKRYDTASTITLSTQEMKKGWYLVTITADENIVGRARLMIK